MKKTFLTLLLVLALLLFACAGGSTPSSPSLHSSSSSSSSLWGEIISPYEDVDWEAFGQYKTALHVHTTNSDGLHSLSEMLEDHYEKDYDIVAITDHDVLTADWVAANNGFTQARYEDIIKGEGRNGRGLLMIPFTNEPSFTEHLNTYFSNYDNSSSGISLEENIQQVQSLNGLCHINHPGRYTGGVHGGTQGEEASNDPENINKYADLFLKYSLCVGMEIINKKDDESASDRILWDNILKKTVPQNRNVWGFSNDDTHNKDHTGFSFNMFVMQSNNTDNFKSAMLSGSFYAVARVSKRELGDSFIGNGPTPIIKNITVNKTEASITITSDNTEKIEWISDGKVIATGSTINLKECENVGSYVRANISGPGGIAFTQPFVLNKNTQN